MIFQVVKVSQGPGFGMAEMIFKLTRSTLCPGGVMAQGCERATSFFTLWHRVRDASSCSECSGTAHEGVVAVAAVQFTERRASHHRSLIVTPMSTRRARSASRCWTPIRVCAATPRHACWLQADRSPFARALRRRSVGTFAYHQAIAPRYPEAARQSRQRRPSAGR